MERIRVPKESFWIRWLGDSDALRPFGLFRARDEAHLDARSMQHLLTLVRVVPPSAALDAPAASLFVNRFEAVPGLVMEIARGAGSDSDDALVSVTPGPLHVPEAGDNRIFTVQVGIGPQPLPFAIPPQPVMVEAEPAKPVEPVGWVANYIALNSYPFPQSLEFDAATLADAGAAPTEAPLDTLQLSGDFSAGFTLSALPFDISQLAVLAGNDYDLVANDNFVGAGESLLVDATELGADDSIMFDGSAETDGRFVFFGGGSDDFFFGGAGDDRIEGRGGADALSGGGGSDVFIYRAPSDSTGADYDTIADFDPAADRIDLPGTVSGFGAAIEGGALSTATFNHDLAAALANLGASQAVWFAPDAGDLAGQVFLIVDGNGRAGYQEGEDFVFAVAGAPLVDLTGHTDIFI